MANDLSIHPRSWPGIGKGEKVNTCAPRSRARIARAIAGIESHVARHPNDAAAKQRLHNTQLRLHGLR